MNTILVDSEKKNKFIDASETQLFIRLITCATEILAIQKGVFLDRGEEPNENIGINSQSPKILNQFKKWRLISSLKEKLISRESYQGEFREICPGLVVERDIFLFSGCKQSRKSWLVGPTLCTPYWLSGSRARIFQSITLLVYIWHIGEVPQFFTIWPWNQNSGAILNETKTYTRGVLRLCKELGDREYCEGP